MTRANSAHVLPKDSIKDKLAIRAAQVRTANRGRGEGGFADTLVHSPTDFLEMDHGHLFIALEVQGQAKEATEVGGIITSVIRDEYYRDLNRDPLASFEASLQRLNEELAEYASSGRLGWVGKVNAVVGVLAGRTLHLTQIGSSHAYLLRGGKLSNISEGLSEAKNPNPLKTFLTIASGDLTANDRLVLGTDSLFFTAPQAELASLLSELSPARALDRLRPELDASNKLERLAAILVEITTEDKLAKAFVETEPSEVVIDRGRTAGIGAAAAPVIGKVVGTTAEATGAAGAVASSRLKLTQIKLSNAIERVRLRAEARERETAPLSAEEPQETAPVSKKESVPAKKKAPTHVAKKKEPFRLPAFPRPHERRTSILLVLVLALSLGVLGWQMQGASEEKAERAAITTAAEKERELATSLSDRERAGRLYAEALEALEPALKSRNADRRKQAEALRATIQTHRDTLDKVTRLTDPAPIADLSGLTDKVQAIGLVAVPGGPLYSADQRTGAVYRISGTSPSVLPVSAALSVADMTLGPENIPVLLLSRGVAEVTDSSVGKPPLSIGEWPGAVDIASFGNFLYLLDSGTGRVWKIPKSVGGYGKAQDYLGNENEQKIRGATSLAIDGSVYILQASGEIWKFNQGARTDFAPSGLPSPISANSDLFIREGFSQLYVLDRSGGRVVILSPSGVYQRSIISDAWKDAKGLWVDEAAKTLHVLAGNKIYRTSL